MMVVAMLSAWTLNHRWPFSLYYTHHGSLADRSTSGMEPLGFVLVPFLAAHVGFVNFDFAKELKAAVLSHELGGFP